MSRVTPKTVHQLKVTLQNVTPPVWRRVQVPSTTKLSDLAWILQAAMGWDGGHLHAFETADRRRYRGPDRDWGSDDLDERKYKLGATLARVGSKIRFDYDFGDGWEHDVVVEAIAPVERGVQYPVCVDGRRACPPEDCGGPWGYGELLEALADPAHERHDEFLEWTGDEFDPAAFDADDTTAAMQAARPFRGW